MSFETEKESYVSPFIRNFSLYSSGMQLLLLAAFDKNLNILSLFDFHHIFLSYQSCFKHHNLTADLKTLPFVFANTFVFLEEYFSPPTLSS